MAGKQFKVKAVFEGEDRSASRTTKEVQGAFSRLGSFLRDRFVITLGDVAAAFRGLASVFSSVIEAANAQENAVKSLDAALAGLGPNAASVSAGLQAQAAALQEVTKYGDEAVIQQQALLATLGVQAEQLPQATQATVDLAAALGISLESAARNVGKTVGGFAGELGEVIPELKELSTEALQAGAGIELLAEKFSGRATADAQTFAGAVSQLSNAFGDFQEDLGETITKSQSAREALRQLTDVISNPALVKTVVTLGRAFAGLATGIVATFARLQQVFTYIPLQVARIVDVLVDLLAKIPLVGEAFQGLGQFTQAAVDKIEAYREAADKVGDTFTDITDSLWTFGDAVDETTDRVQANTGALTTNAAAARETAEANEQAGESYEEQVREVAAATAALREHTQTVNANTTATIQNAQAATAAAEAQSGYSQNLLGGQSSFAQISGGTFAAPSGNRLGRTTSNVPGRVNRV